MGEIHGDIEGKHVILRKSAAIVGMGANHFIVTSGDEIKEIFLTETGLLSDGNTLDNIVVSIETEKDKIVRDRFSQYQTGSVSSAASKGMILKASMPGMVKVVSVKIGDKVQKNTQVLVLEAMKMENSITAGFSGIVSKIYIEAGMSVEKNMPLIEFLRVD